MENLRISAMRLLESLIIENYKNVEMIEQLVLDLSGTYKIKSLFVRQILMRVKQVKDLSDIQLFFFLKCMLKNNKNRDKSILKEMETFIHMNYGAIDEELLQSNIKFSYKIGKVMELNNQEWIGVIKPINLYYLIDCEIISLERCKKNKFRAIGEEFKIQNKNNSTSITEIGELIKRGKYRIPQLVFIFSPDVKYDIQESELYLDRGKLILIDGYHNYKAIINLYKRHCLISQSISIKIINNITEDELANYLYNNMKNNKPSINCR